MGDNTLFDRYERIDGVDLSVLRRTHVTMVGAGGLGGEISRGLVRKGIGALTAIDFDGVEPSNLPRQQFTLRDVGVNKAQALAKNLLAQATATTQITAYAGPLQEALADPHFVPGDLFVVGVDNNSTRIDAAHYCLQHGIPAVFLAVDQQAAKGYVFVQLSTPGAPCFVCYDPNAPGDERIFGCAGASIEILMATAGIALYAIDSLLMPRPRPWNLKEIFFDARDSARTIVVRATCAFCGANQAA